MNNSSNVKKNIKINKEFGVMGCWIVHLILSPHRWGGLNISLSYIRTNIRTSLQHSVIRLILSMKHSPAAAKALADEPIRLNSG